mmetsp:Transcript_32901/g.52951  ORF Transcript_32901/g.52951 Transcript_32901/m.52951 type:complete len:149 (-) Transcript_32901:581-1027(-)
MHPLGAATIWDVDFFRMTGVKRQEYLLVFSRAQLEAMGTCLSKQKLYCCSAAQYGPGRPLQPPLPQPMQPGSPMGPPIGPPIGPPMGPPIGPIWPPIPFIGPPMGPPIGLPMLIVPMPIPLPAPSFSGAGSRSFACNFPFRSTAMKAT